MSERFAQVAGLELCYEEFGAPQDPAVLLVMGLGTQMLGWREEFCERLAAEGLRVIRYDNRDIGRSTHMSDVPPPKLSELLLRRVRDPAYTLDDMADDAVGLLDALGIARAHVVGASMGGMIAQLVAIRHPGRILSLTSIMSNTGKRFSGQPAMRVLPLLAKPPARTREDQMDHVERLFGIVGSPGFEQDVAITRENAGMAFDREPDRRGGGRQLGAIIAAPPRDAALARLDVPTLVIHGTKDRLVSPSGGRDTAAAIPGARLLMVPGMGHDLPRGAWPQLVAAIAGHARAAEAARPQAAAA